MQRTLSILPGVVAVGFVLCQPAVSAPNHEHQVRVLRSPHPALAVLASLVSAVSSLPQCSRHGHRQRQEGRPCKSGPGR